MTQLNEFAGNEGKRNYHAPRLTAIGEAREVILGVSAVGDDFMGYGDPQFEYEADAIGSVADESIAAGDGGPITSV